MICPNCGNEIDNTVSECPNCGFQMTATESVKENHIQNESQSLNYDNINQTTAGKSLIKPKMSKKKKIIFIILAIILAFLIGRVIEVIINNINHNSSSSYSDVVSDFTIEGTWRNIGNTTCAQIQEGSVINFDGENCNVYSPNDTYAFYESDGVYHLDCTSFFAGDSLCFTVNIIDYDNIELVSSNSTIIQLCRVGGTEATNNEYRETDIPITEVPDIDIPVKSTEFDYTDGNGYSYHVTVNMSPWISNNKTDVLNSAINKVCKNEHNFPTDEAGWLEFFGSKSTTSNQFIYVAFGRISILNTTSGWDFSENNPGYPIIYGDHYTNGDHTPCLSRIFYSNSTEIDLNFNCKMTGNNAGIDFVVGYYDNKTPNNPNGMYFDKLNEGQFRFYGSFRELNELSVGVYQ